MVSVIITTYNRPISILSRAINSVRNQSYKDWELIIVNDFPKNKELVKKIESLIKEYNDERIIYEVHKENKGACEARNTGIKIASGEIIAFLDDDDEWIEYKLEKILPYFNDNDVSLVYSDYICKYGANEKIHKIKEFTNNPFKSLLVKNYIGSTSFPVMRKKSVIDVGGFNVEMKACQDLDLWIRLAQKYKFAYCQEALTKYYFSEECITKNIDARIESHEKLIKKYINEYNQDKRLLKLKYLNMTYDFIVSGHREYSNLYLDKCKKISKLKIEDYILIIRANLIDLRNKLIKR